MANYSRQREAVKTYLMSTTEHPTADMVYDAVRAQYPAISLATVYRNLNLLIEMGQAVKIISSFGPDRFDGCVTPHNHFHCRKCNRVMDIWPLSETIEVTDTFKDEFKGKIESRTINYYGLCENCLED